MWKMSKAGEAFLAGWEGTVLRPYNDSVSNATIGIGHLIHLGPVTTLDVARYTHYRGPHGHRRPHAFDLEDAYTLLADDIASFERDLADYIHVPLNQHQVDATLDLIYNCGPAPLASRFGALLNQRAYRPAADEMLNWDHAGGQVLLGLQRRRQAEHALFLS
jgi:lysozyme